MVPQAILLALAIVAIGFNVMHDASHDAYSESPLVNRLQRTLAPVSAHPVTRTLREGDLVSGFEVLEVPGHSRGALAFWRERDRVLVCGDVLANFGLHPTRPRLVLAPAALSSDYEQNRRSAARLAELRPRLLRWRSRPCSWPPTNPPPSPASSSQRRQRGYPS